MRLTHHNLFSNHGPAHISGTLSHLAGSRSYTGIVAFSLFFTLSIIAMLLLLWFIYLRRREQQMQASGMPGIAFGGQMIIPQPQIFGGVPMGQPIMQTQAVAQPGFILPPWLNCEDNMSPPPLNASALGSTYRPTTIPIRTSTVQNIPLNTSMTGIQLQSTIGQPLNQMQVTEIVTVTPTQISAIAGLPIMPIQASRISNVGMTEAITTHNISLASQGLMDPLFNSAHDARQMVEMGMMVPQIVYDNRLPSPTNSIMQQMQLPYMLVELPYSSEGPDIPMTVSRILGPSPTAGHRIPNNMSPPSLPPHLTEAGLRLSHAHHQMGIVDLMPSGNILGLDVIKSVPQMGPPIQNLPLLKKTTTTTEIVQPANQLTYPILSSPPVRPVSPYAPMVTSTGGVPGAMPRAISPGLPLFRP